MILNDYSTTFAYGLQEELLKLGYMCDVRIQMHLGGPMRFTVFAVRSRNANVGIDFAIDDRILMEQDMQQLKEHVANDIANKFQEHILGGLCGA